MIEPLIRHHADEAERHRRLPLPVVQALTDAGIFRMCVPRALDGLEVPPLTFYRVVEAVARLGGSAGWCTFIGGSDGLVGAYLAPQTAEDLFGRDPRVVLAGSVAPAGSATVMAGGYRVSGRWPYASGSQHCTWVFGGCHVLDGDQPRLTAPVRPEVRMVLIPAAQATILEDTWEVSGLVGTGSHDFTVEQVFVPAALRGALAPACRVARITRGPCIGFRRRLFRLPVSAVALGIAQGAIEACIELAPTKRAMVGTGVLRDQPFFQARIAEAVALVRSARAWLRRCSRRGPPRYQWDASVAERADLVLAAVHATRSAAEAVQLVYTVAGGRRTIAAVRCNGRCAMSTTQHIGTAPQQYEEAGRMVLGLEPLQPILLW